MKKTNTFSLFRIPNLAFCNAVSTLKTIQTKPNDLNHIYGYSSVRYVWPHLKTCFSEFNHIKKIPRKIWRWNKKNEKCHLWFYILNLELFGNTENLFRRTSFRNSIQEYFYGLPDYGQLCQNYVLLLIYPTISFSWRKVFHFLSILFDNFRIFTQTLTFIKCN